jgi:hypothetical protein
MKRTLRRTILFFCLSFTALTARGQELEWVQSMGGAGSDETRSMVTDKDGNVYISGTFNGTADFNQRRGVDTLRSAGSTDVFLAKYDAAGNYLWSRRGGGTGADYSRDVAVDAHGNVYVIGYFVAKATFNPAGGDTLYAGTGFQDIFVVKYDANGNYKWAINMGGSGINYGYGIAISETGDIYTTGYFSGKTDFNADKGPADTATLTALPNNFFNPGYDIFVAKYDSLGKYQWAIGMGNDQFNDYGQKIVVDKAGNAYVTGYFARWADFDPGAGAAVLEARGDIGYDGFVAKYDKDGNYVWAKGIGSKHDDNGLDIAIDEGNHLYVTGYYSDTTTFYDTTSNPGVRISYDTLVSAGNFDMYLVKYDSAGSYLWSRTLSGKNDELGLGVSVGRGGMVCVTGYLSDTAYLSGSGERMISAGSWDPFIAKFTPDGEQKWAGRFGGTQADFGYGIVCDQEGSIYNTGYYMGTADLEPGPGNTNFASVGGADIYLLKLLCSDTSSATLYQHACGTSYTLNGQTYTASGTYTQILTNSSGCDSFLTIHLELSDPKAMITVNAYLLGTTLRYTSYQWIKDGVAIPGATDSTYLVTENAGYQVAVADDHGCVDTSDVYAVTNVGVEANNMAARIKVYPNPARDVLYIASPAAVHAVLTTMEGRVALQVANAHSLSLSQLPAGVYFLRLLDQEQRLIRMDKVIKE